MSEARRSPLHNALVGIVAVLLTIGAGAVASVTLHDHAEYCARTGCD